jgi:hypothetical protein
VIGPPPLSATAGREATRLRGVAGRRGPVAWRTDDAARVFWGPATPLRREVDGDPEERRAGAAVVRIWGRARPLRLGTPVAVTALAEKRA